MTMGIYLVTCIANGRKYVGSSVDIEARWRKHRYDLNHRRHENDHLQNAWNKHGEKKFEWSILEIVETNGAYLTAREQHWIDTLHPEFNATQFAINIAWDEQTKERWRQHIAKSQRKFWASLSEDEREARKQALRDAWANGDKEWRRAIQQAAWSNKPSEWKQETIERLRRQSAENAILKLARNAIHRAEVEAEKERKRLEREQQAAERERKKAEWEAGRAERRRAQIEKIRATVNALWQDPAYRAKHQKATRKAMKDPEVLKRLSESHKGKPLSAEHVDKIAAFHRGRKRPPETGRKISKAKMGHPVSEETRRKISESKRRKSTGSK